MSHAACMSEIFRIAMHVRSFVTEDGGTILDVDSGTYYGLNPIGAAIWNELKAERTKEEILSNLLNTFDVSAEKLHAEVDAFLDRLVKLRLVDQSLSYRLLHK
ncbi:MAG: hypothetical protein DMG36_03190 [Acidobacteria bacterium]|nr:MAG: hypothetical protein DMG36_03190 [Acidobacteriota bacterium]